MSIHSPKKTSLSLLDFELVTLRSGEKKLYRSSRYETVAVLIEGECQFGVGRERSVFQRRSVFLDKASVAYVPPNTTLSLSAHTATIIAMCKARALGTASHSGVLRGQRAMKAEWRGKRGYRRKVYNLLHLETPTERIAVGETFNQPGEWSSFPPHKHDAQVKRKNSVVEAPLEEIYYFRVEPKTGFGFQRVYTADGKIDESYAIHDGDVTKIPRGYHPVSAMPGHKLYYLWMLAGDERTYVWNTSDAFRWMEK